MKCIVPLLLTVSMLLLFTSCALRQSDDYPLEEPSSIHETDSSVMQDTSSVGPYPDPSDDNSPAANILPPGNNAIDITGFTTIGYDYEPGDLKYKIELTEEEQEELRTLLEAGKWTLLEAAERPEHGLNCVLRALGNDRSLFVYEFDSQNSIIGIVIDGGTKTYWAPSQVAEKSKSFMEHLRSQRGQGA